MTTSWVDELERDAPDVVAAWRGIAEEEVLRVRREVRRRAGAGSVARILDQLAATATAMIEITSDLPDATFGMPGGEADWTAHLEQLHTIAGRLAGPAADGESVG
jgi:hypothetical protein